MTVSKNIKIPSLKQFERLPNVDKAQAKAMRAIMVAYAPLAGLKRDYRDSREAGAMGVLDYLYETCGVESFDMIHRNGRKYTIYYLNTGDTYNTTILYIKPENGYPRYEIGCWGDWAEKQREVK